MAYQDLAYQRSVWLALKFFLEEQCEELYEEDYLPSKSAKVPEDAVQVVSEKVKEQIQQLEKSLSQYVLTKGGLRGTKAPTTKAIKSASKKRPVSTKGSKTPASKSRRTRSKS